MDIVSVGMEQSTDVKNQEKDGVDLNSVELGIQFLEKSLSGSLKNNDTISSSQINYRLVASYIKGM